VTFAFWSAIMSTLHNPFLRGFQDLSYERVVQISYADDCPPCYRPLHPALHDLPDDGINTSRRPPGAFFMVAPA
jgi:hypothetical protein